jgi:hypothetical protein
MEEVLRELTGFELDAVAGGDPFGIHSAVFATVNNNGDFAVGAVGAEATILTQFLNTGNTGIVV